ncbi:unnamed protein product [Onchocerca flexuosa]|uniref:Biogenesis of lysosome-related organelles complex 1 subunit 5 n=1 Tax=Onchocerca flexuosa TaxID=387005 RepID=A0A183HBP1_9BILA|nr:unnamed protein product [Onchocerca flexuosa]
MFIGDAQNYYEILFEQHNKFSDFIVNNVKEYELLGKNFYEVSNNYTNRTVSQAEDMKRMISDVLETYIKTTKEETQQVSEKLRSFKNEQQSICEKQRIYVETAVKESLPNKTAWGARRQDFSEKITLQRECVDEVS